MIWKIVLACFGALFFFSLGVIVGKAALRDELELEALQRRLLETPKSCDPREE